MNDSLERLALSCTFAVIKGKMAQVEEAASDPDSTSSLKPDFVVDCKYRVIGQIDKGGMGTVYKVHHELLKKNMALKTFSTHNLSNESWQRFQREAQAIAKLRHKNIVEVFDFGIANGERPYYTMELIEGESLAQRLTRLGPCDTVLALRLFIQVADAMAHAHRLHIVHRDIKPANIFLAQSPAAAMSEGAASLAFGTSIASGTFVAAGTSATSGPSITSGTSVASGASITSGTSVTPGTAVIPEVKIVDFGIAKLATQTTLEEQYLTSVGTIFGSPLYMSPEQCMGVPVDQRSDIYSFGCSLFHALTGRPPFVGDNAFLTLMSHQNETPPTLKDVTPARQSLRRLDLILEKLLAKHPDQRYQTFEQVQEALTDCLSAVQAKVPAVAGNQDNVAPHTAAANAEEKKTFPPGIVRISLLAGVALCVALAVIFSSTSTNKSTSVLPKNAQGVAGLDGQGLLVDLPQHEADHKDSTTGKTPAVKQQFFPVSIKEGVHGQVKTFFFPTGKSNVYLKINEKNEEVRCTGAYTAPVNARLVLVCYEGVSPEFIQRFRPDDLFGVELKVLLTEGEWTKAHMEAISGLHGLKQLDINKTDIDGSSIQYINKLVNLRHLNVSDTKISGEDLTRISMIPRLEVLGASGLANVVGFLKAMPSQCVMDTISLGRDHLTDNDMPALAQMVSLQDIRLDSDLITDKGLKSLENMPHLFHLSLANVQLSPRCIETISHMRSLHYLRIPFKRWPLLDQLRLKNALPKGCTLTEGNVDRTDER